MVAARSVWLRAIRCNSALPPRAFHVAAALADLPSWTATGEAWPSIGYLAEGLGISEKVVRTALRALTEAGYIEISQRGGRGFTNKYLMIPSAKPCPLGEGLAAEKVPCREPPPFPEGQGSKLNEKLYIPPVPPSHQGRQGEDDFTEFLSSYPTTLPERLNVAGIRRAYAQALADGVKPAQVPAGARYYARICTGRDPRYVASPRKWLAEARWQETPQSFASKVIPQPIVAEDEITRAVSLAMRSENRGDWVFVHEGSAAWREWRTAFLLTGRPFAAGRLKVGEGRGRSFPTEFPPVVIASSMVGNRSECCGLQ